ncbi:MAG: histidine kinase [Sphingomonas sp.]
MTAPNDPLHTRLPQGVLSDLGGWTLYQSFRTFTWPWLLRRGAVFWPLAIIAGAAYGGWHASGMGAWSDWPGLALRASLASLAAVTAGPLLATAARYLHLPLLAERVLVVLAILSGLWIGAIALDWAGAYHNHLMQQYTGGSMDISLFGRLMSKFLYTTMNTSTLVLAFVGGGLAMIYYFGERRRIAQHSARHQLERLRGERDAADMRLAVLQAQVEPHFLFNTLASVRSLIASEPGRAAQTVDALATYLRATLPRFRDANVEEATLDRQLDICTGYLELMNVRMAGRLAYRVEADGNARAAAFPPLILLTLVENAVTHGIEPRPGPGAITIRAQVDHDWLVVSVEDEGIGLREGVTQGVGLANVRAQLRNRFDDRASLEIVARPEGGTRASIRIAQA